MSRLRSLHRADENRQRPHQRQQYHQEGYEEEPPHDGLMVGAVGFRIRRLISLPNQESLLRIMAKGAKDRKPNKNHTEEIGAYSGVCIQCILSYMRLVL